MAVTSLHQPTGRWLTSLGKDAVAGSVHHLSFGSFAYSRPVGGFGHMGCEFTRYTLSEPVAVNQYGEPLFDLDECDPRCPIDDSSQIGHVCGSECWSHNRASLAA